MGKPSRVVELQAALDALISADAQLLAMGHTVWTGSAPEGTANPYTVIGRSSDSRVNAFRGGSARENVETLDVWGEDKVQCSLVYGHILRLLDGAKLALSSGQQLSGRVSLTLSIADPDGGWHSVVDYTSLNA